MDRPSQPLAFPALLFGSALLAVGPWLVRLADVGPVAAGFWRLALALPFLFILAALAKQHSDDPGSKERGGDLDFFGPGQMVQPFNDVAFKLQPGVISDIVETQFGYHIIKVTEKKAGQKVSLQDARGEIERRLQMANRDRYTQEFVNALRQKAKVEILI